MIGGLPQVPLADLTKEVEWRRCRGSGPADVDAEMYFMRNFWRIKHPERGAMLLELRGAQEQTLRDWVGYRMSITLKARQVGFSTIASAHMFWLAFFHDDKPLIALSKTEREAMKLLGKVKYGYARLPEWMVLRGPKRTVDTQTKMEFGNGSTIESLPATDPARGESAYCIIVDEWAFFEDPEGAWSAIEPAADIGGRVIALSTANGSGNLYHQMWVAASTGSSSFHPIFHSWRAVPERDDAWYAAKKRDLIHDWRLHQEYPSSPDEAFIKSGNAVFDVDALDEIEAVEPSRGFLSAADGARSSRFVAGADGPLHIWEMPNPKHRYVMGVDVAEGLLHGDYSVAHVIDMANGNVVAKWRGHVAADLMGSDVAWHLGWFYGAALAVIEVNNHGLTTVTALRDKQYPNIYTRTTMGKRQDKAGTALGFRTQRNTKPMIIDLLALALRDGADGGVVLRDSESIAELRTFVRDGDGKMHGSPFDDQVMALALANFGRGFTFQPEFVSAADDTMTLAWLERQMAEDSAKQRAGGGLRVGAGNRRRP